MTIKDLIQELLEYPLDTRVVFTPGVSTAGETFEGVEVWGGCVFESDFYIGDGEHQDLEGCARAVCIAQVRQ